MNLTYHDQLEIEKADARNTVEEYVYSMRDKLDYDLNDYITEADKEVFKAVLTSTEDWLYEEGEDQPKKVYVDKAAELKKLGDPVVLREQEWRERPPAFEELGKMIVHYEKILKKYGDGVSQPKNDATHKCIFVVYHCLTGNSCARNFLNSAFLVSSTKLPFMKNFSLDKFLLYNNYCMLVAVKLLSWLSLCISHSLLSIPSP